MFQVDDRPNLYAIPIGVDFAEGFAAGLLRRFDGRPPEDLARTLILTNAARMGTAIRAALSRQGARLLPQILPVAGLPDHPGLGLDLPPPVPPLRRQLLLAQAVGTLLEAAPDTAPRSARFMLAEGLARLMDEFQADGIAPQALEEIDVGQHSEYWARSLSFLRIITEHWDARPGTDPQDRLRHTAEALSARWRASPPPGAVIVAGSTGSRAATAQLMEVVSALPAGAVVLPGWDDCLPSAVWDGLGAAHVPDDHPQSMLHAIARRLGHDPARLHPWDNSARPVAPARARLLSLALRPAPFTDAWLEEGPALRDDLPEATAGLTLLTAASPKEEADAIALRLRKAVADGQTAVLISPDRGLTRRVESTLGRWGITPDDSAGRPLQQTPPGVFFRLIANCIGQPLTPDVFVALLRHPMTARQDPESGAKLMARLFEIGRLRGGPPEVTPDLLRDWAAEQRAGGAPADARRALWADWVGRSVMPLSRLSRTDLAGFLAAHRAAAEALVAGPGGVAGDTLWQEEDGKALARALDELSAQADVAGIDNATDYRSLLGSVLSSKEARETRHSHPDIAVWGTLESRVGQRDVVILGGLNDDTWPGSETPDPWLNRAMRQQIGLPTPDRQTGLSAHDFQQAAAAPEVVLSRALRSGDAPTVGSRWLVRLMNLMGGMGEAGKVALARMTARGDDLLALARRLDRPARRLPPAPRPAPAPPVEHRFTSLSVTSVERLIRDPYSIYAERILRLKKLLPLGSAADAMARGITLHEVMERFNQAHPADLPQDAPRAFLDEARRTFEELVPWPGVRLLWMTRLSRVAGHLMAEEAARRTQGRIAAMEVWGERSLSNPPVRLFGKADRIDRRTDGRLALYDYKSGKPPSTGEQEHFQKQLMLEAAMAEPGGFAIRDTEGTRIPIPGAEVAWLEYIGLSGDGLSVETKTEGRPFTAAETAQVWDEFTQLVTAYHTADVGFPSRVKMQQMKYAFDYDQLARRGEWQDTDDPVMVPVP